MAISTESNPPLRPGDSSTGARAPGGAAARAAGGEPPKLDLRGLSALSESALETTILRRGLATPQEIEMCRAHRERLIASGKEDMNLFEIMVAAKVLTPSQLQRVVKEAGPDAQRKLEIPGYEILGRIGKGSMGMVYKAKQTSVDRIVALKVLLDALAKNKEFIRRFVQEAKIAAKLSHNNIVGVIDAGEVNGVNYFVMEYVEGTDIKSVLEKEKVVEERRAVEIILAVAEALAHANQRGLIHRDIKPENIILTKEGGVKLADLGLARLTTDEKWAMAEAGMAIGTPYYISPEQVRGQVDVDIRADIYSLGATFYHMATGRVPYEGESPSEVMRKHVDKSVELIPPDHLNPKLSSGLGEVVETMMARNREHRYRRPEDLILDLNCLLRGERPIIAEQKASSLANLAEGEVSEEDQTSAIAEAEKLEMAGYVNRKNNVITFLAVFLGLSVVANIVLLTVVR